MSTFVWLGKNVNIKLENRLIDSIYENLLSVIVLAIICCVGPLMPLPVIAVKLNLYCVAGFRPLIL